jgi:hypothetical protein
VLSPVVTQVEKCTYLDNIVTCRSFGIYIL